MKINAVIFDWDGVIVDSMSVLLIAIQETAASYGVNLSLETLIRDYFQPAQAFYASIGVAPADLGELNRRHKAASYRHMSPFAIFPDVKPALITLAAKGIKLGIVTARDEREFAGELDRLLIAEIFTPELVCIDARTKEDTLRVLVEKTAVEPKMILYVGDLPSDIVAAKNVGIKSAAISRGETAERLKNENPDIILTSLLGLPALVEKA